ncbi:hypothetical protein BuS5_03220 [Desulfosarcina sp. BuS5]|uniref:hypothetical protein n=1 Tax=Desulfosarcina sp. BuS5 TaxID=933262 RepID=UPI00047F6261|nr:hypothetical protein [Desulfosarcina sp. BuS5]WDN90249.1 hypothetical protein BuS5_03220 [Desulfosarcina sp. BuS5]
MSIANAMALIIDNGGRRLGFDRRQFYYTDYTPPRRGDIDRRNGLDRRSGLDRRKNVGAAIEAGIIDMRKLKERRRLADRRASFARTRKNTTYRH